MDVPGKGFFSNLSEKGIKQTVTDKFNETARAILAGISPKEVRALLRGDPPPRNLTPAIGLRSNHLCCTSGPNFTRRVQPGLVTPSV